MSHPEIFLIRHGETTWNRIGRHQGHLDSVLTLGGITQVQGVARRLACEIDDWPGVVLACSPLYRCRQTAAILCDEVGANVEHIVYDDRLKERSFGHWQGLIDAEIMAQYPDEWAACEADRWSYVIPGGGENYPVLGDRMMEWLDEQASDRPIVLVTHGEAGRALRGRLLGLPPAETLVLSKPQTAAFHLADGKAVLLEGDFPEPGDD
jgi:probable phosphoglycerate mutase